MEVLLLADMQTVWDSCVSQYGKKCRADFNALLTKSKTSRKDKVRAVAFVVRKLDKNQDSLIKRLLQLDYEVIIKVFADDQAIDFSAEMKDILQEYNESCESVVLAGGNPNCVSVLEAANNLGKHTMIVGFSHGIDKACAQVADDVRVLARKDTVSS